MDAFLSYILKAVIANPGISKEYQTINLKLAFEAILDKPLAEIKLN